MSHIWLRGFRLPEPLCWRLGDAVAGASKGSLRCAPPATPAQHTSLLETGRGRGGRGGGGIMRDGGGAWSGRLGEQEVGKASFPCFTFLGASCTPLGAVPKMGGRKYMAVVRCFSPGDSLRLFYRWCCPVCPTRVSFIGRSGSPASSSYTGLRGKPQTQSL